MMKTDRIQRGKSLESGSSSNANKTKKTGDGLPLRKGQTTYTSITKVFSSAKTLYKHLLHILPEDIGGKLLQKDDSKAYLSLLQDSMVVPTQSSAANSDHESASNVVQIETNRSAARPTPPIREVLSNIVAQITRAANALQLAPREQNVLCLGYRRKAVNATAFMRNHIDIECFTINTIQTLLISPAWQLLLNRIGKSFFCYLIPSRR